MFRLAYRNFGDHEALVRPENGQRCPEADAQAETNPRQLRGVKGLTPSRSGTALAIQKHPDHKRLSPR